jgi:hypothetical protein
MTAFELLTDNQKINFFSQLQILSIGAYEIRYSGHGGK